MAKKALFLAKENAEFFLERIDTVFFRHGLTWRSVAATKSSSKQNVP
jgi:hypothetical protein